MFAHAYHVGDIECFALVDYDGRLRRGAASERIFTGRIRHRDVAVTRRGNGRASADSGGR